MCNLPRSLIIIIADDDDDDFNATAPEGRLITAKDCTWFLCHLIRSNCGS